jgi:hypothetical protein
MRWLTPDDNDMDSARYDMVAQWGCCWQVQIAIGDANEVVVSPVDEMTAEAGSYILHTISYKRYGVADSG